MNRLPHLISTITKGTLLAVAVLCARGCDPRDARVEAEIALADGDYRRAQILLREAIDTATDDADRGQILCSLGLAQMRLESLAEAELSIVDGIATARRADRPDGEARCRRYLAEVHERREHFELARRQLALARAHYERHGPQRDLVTTQIFEAGVAYRQQDFAGALSGFLGAKAEARRLDAALLGALADEGVAVIFDRVGERANAIALYRRASAVYRSLGHRYNLATCLANLAVAYLASGAPESAFALLPELRSLAEEIGNVELGCNNDLIEAEAHLAEGRPAEAIAPAERVVDRVASYGTRNTGYALLFLGLAQFGIGALDAADSALDRARALPARERDLEPLLDILDGRISERRGDLDRAITAYARAVERLETDRVLLDVETGRDFLTRQRIVAYSRLIELHVGADRTFDAARISAMAKGRSTVDRLLPIAEADIDEPGDRVEQRILNRVALADAEAGWTLPNDFDVGLSAARLDPGLAVVDYFIVDDGLVIIWIDRDGAFTRRVDIDSEWLRKTARGAFDALANRDPSAASLLQALSGVLLTPIADALNERQPSYLGIVPHGELHDIPFEALPWAGGVLIDTWPVFSLPSLALLPILIDDRREPERIRFVGVADAKGDLPAARARAVALARRDNSASLIGLQARESRFREQLVGADRVHIAVHGHPPTMRRTAWLELLPDPQHDGHLYADEIAAMPIDAHLVVVSACHSSADRATPGDERLGALDVAFLRAGARAVVGSRWPLDDATASAFAEHFYAQLDAGATRLDAFAEAQRSVRHGELTDCVGTTRVRGIQPRRSEATRDCTDPFYWAALSFTGAYR